MTFSLWLYLIWYSGNAWGIQTSIRGSAEWSYFGIYEQNSVVHPGVRCAAFRRREPSSFTRVSQVHMYTHTQCLAVDDFCPWLFLVYFSMDSKRSKMNLETLVYVSELKSWGTEVWRNSIILMWRVCYHRSIKICFQQF